MKQNWFIEQDAITRIHVSYHKCLTVYFARVFHSIYGGLSGRDDGYHHFNSHIGRFYQKRSAYRVASINNHALDLSRLEGEFRITRFIRDPRDLVVSGYYYHKRGAEKWCEIPNPDETDWKIVNGVVPSQLKLGDSFASYLRACSVEDGLLAEIEFRKNHFESMRHWPLDDQRIKLFWYEDIIGNERQVFAAIFEHLQLTRVEQALGKLTAERFAARRVEPSSTHIRNPVPGQWQNVFTPAVNKFFMMQYGDLLERYGYA